MSLNRKLIDQEVRESAAYMRNWFKTSAPTGFVRPSTKDSMRYAAQEGAELMSAAMKELLDHRRNPDSDVSDSVVELSDMVAMLMTAVSVREDAGLDNRQPYDFDMIFMAVVEAYSLCILGNDAWYDAVVNAMTMIRLAWDENGETSFEDYCRMFTDKIERRFKE